MKIRAAVALGALLTAACGGREVVTVHTSVSPFPPPSPSPAALAASPTPRPAGLLFAVLEGQPANTIAIAGLDGYARAKQKFTPRAVPPLCDATELTQPEARVAAGEVFYADGSGAVRSLDPTGRVADVTSFGVASQQILSFAVDPGGHQLLGARLTIPTWSGGPPCSQQGQFVVDLLSAAAGGAAQLSSHQTYQRDDSSANLVQAVGWDPAGALVTVRTSIGTQNGTLGQKWYGQLAHWTPEGVGSVVGGGDCRAQDEVANSIACISNAGEGAGSVRSPDGSIQWNVPSAIYYFILLAPDATKAAYCNSSECGVAGKDGSHLKLPAHFSPTGWLDSSTLIGVDQPLSLYGELKTVALADPAKVNDLGFKGSFAGVVQAS